jgi:CubicO group peptidase (beta-lactamase class C family)
MRVLRLLTLALATSLVAIGGGVPVSARTAQLTEAQARSLGFSTVGLKQLDAGMQGFIDNKQLAGIVTVLARHGEVVQQKAYGYQNIAAGQRMREDTIFRIYSMTKPVVGVAMMMLYEEGKWQPTDPIAKHLPEFANVKVFSRMGEDGQPVLEAPLHAPTVGELMSHLAGFTYGFFGSTPVDKMYRDANVLGAASLPEFSQKLAQLPLSYQPGEAWIYSVSVDLQGYLVEKLSGKPLGVFMRERIFQPLGMKDTDFFVPEAKLPRLATTYSDSTEGLKPNEHDPNVSRDPGMPSGGGGLYSTAGDYLRFAQMLLDGGELDGTRLLKTSSVATLRTNKLTPELLSGKFGIGPYRMQPGSGFGYDVAVIHDPAEAKSPSGKGTYQWFGLAGTWFWVDPANDLIFIGMIQRLGGLGGGAQGIEPTARKLTYQALVDPSR